MTIKHYMDREPNGRFAKLTVKESKPKPKKMKTWRQVMWLVFITQVMYLGCTFADKVYSNDFGTTQVKAEEISSDTLSLKIDELKEEVLDLIKKGESMSAGEQDALITFDPHPKNKKVQQASIGSYQFKISTVQYYYKKLYNKDITRKEALLIALDDKEARALTKDIVFKDKGIGNWFNTKNKYNLDKKIAIISSLEK